MNFRIKTIVLSIMFSNFILSSTIVQANEFPKQFFGIKVGVKYDSVDDLPVTITNKYMGKLGILSGESHFKPKKDLPMFPSFSKGDEEAYNYAVTIIDVTGNVKPAKIIPLVVGWRIKKPFNNNKYSYTRKMAYICNMFKEDLKDVADPSIPDVRDKDLQLSEVIKTNLQNKNESTCVFFPSTPLSERNLHYKSYLEYANDNNKIAVRYYINPLVKGGEMYEELSVNYELSNNKFLQHLNDIKTATDEINRQILKDKADSNRPY